MNIIGKISDLFHKDGNLNELWFITLGPSGAGKTSLLACMYRSFENSTLRGFLFPDRGEDHASSIGGDTDTFLTLDVAYKQLKAMGDSEANLILVPPLVEGTPTLRQHVFSIRGERESARIRFFDYPGAWMNPHAKNDVDVENNKRIIEFAHKSMVIIVAIDTPYLMEGDGQYKEHAKLDAIQYFLAESMNPVNTLNPNYKADKLILLVPVKCEKYTRTPEDANKLRKKIRECFEATIELTDNPILEQHLALAILPVQTTGNVEFSHFEIKGGIPVQRYMRSGQVKFCPRDVEQPFRYAMSFLLNQYDKKRRSYWMSIINRLFGRDNLKSVSEVIRRGMHEDGERGFEIIHGRDLIVGK